MAFDLKHIESFVSVAETLSFSTAAARANTVQSAISTHVMLLEQQLDRTLIKRGRGQPVTITADGAAFLVQARRLLALTDEMARRPETAAGMTPLRLGTTITFALSVIPKAISACADRTNTRRVTVRTARSHDLIDLLEQGEIDVALMFDQGAHAARQATMRTKLSWVAGDKYVHDDTKPLPLAFLEDARDLRRHAFAALDKGGAHAASLQSHPDPIGLRAVLAAGLAISVMPQVAIVAPLVDVGARLGLPDLEPKLVSIYAMGGVQDRYLDGLCHALEAQCDPAG
ncbi:LysR family transcriptional regulator [Yoonia maricola]|uniref:LysR family transcriptional regulator n=1 Tax=Yoonia maricola TaxID=420999 RepID=A0A2M8WMZ5_9RHOB|nr:LysR family transcriptional regulator [Yoonia maricola]PJI92307.1 LysR family transcriptional regulator [Yoonia maricola]